MKNKISINIVILFIVLNTLALNPFVDAVLSQESKVREIETSSQSIREKSFSSQGKELEPKSELFLSGFDFKKYIPTRVVSSEKWLGMIF